jgi:hypothetical protein
MTFCRRPLRATAVAALPHKEGRCNDQEDQYCANYEEYGAWKLVELFH